VRILVTGAEGFVGSHLIPSLESDGHEVLGSDRVDCDLALPGQAEALITDTVPDYVIHLAARYGRLLCRDQPHRAVADNAAATTELAAVCEERGIRVLYASSSEVYGDHGTSLIREDSVLRTPTTIYGLSKRWGEEALRLYLFPEQLTIVRLNMLYGPGQRAGYGCCALATFIRDALEGRPLTVHRDASRSWLYIDDAVRALKLLIGCPGIWNVANREERLSMAAVADIVRARTGAPRENINYIPAPAGQIRHKNYSTTKLEGLGWRPEVPLDVGVRLTVEAARRDGMRDYALATEGEA
jgi:nucleoside-diphosphate-sugar epimerase